MDWLKNLYQQYLQSDIPAASLLRGDTSEFLPSVNRNLDQNLSLLSTPEGAMDLVNPMAKVGGLLGTTKLYHGTSPEVARRILKEGFDVSKSADNTGWFTTNKSIGDNITTGKGAVLESSIDESKLKLAGWDEIDKYSINELINQGYDGVKMTDNGETVYQLFYPEKMQYEVLK